MMTWWIKRCFPHRRHDAGSAGCCFLAARYCDAAIDRGKQQLEWRLPWVAEVGAATTQHWRSHQPRYPQVFQQQ
jgi:hypothetical protein